MPNLITHYQMPQSQAGTPSKLFFSSTPLGLHIDILRYFYNSWRPITAIRRPGIWLASGKHASDPTWEPLLTPTPNHQDYLSTHATFGGAAAAVIRAWNGGDKIDATISSNVTVDNVGVITRRIMNLTAAAIENGQSRIFGGVSILLVFKGRRECRMEANFLADPFSICFRGGE